MKFFKSPAYLAIAIVFFVPSIALAQDILTLISQAGGILSDLLPLVVGLGLLAFFWGLAKFIFKAGDENAREGGRQVMLWGIIAIFVMVSIWGIVRFAQTVFGLDTADNISIPAIDFVPGGFSN